MGYFSLEFWLFFPLLATGYYVPRFLGRENRWALLLVASAIFLTVRQPLAFATLLVLAGLTFQFAKLLAAAGDDASKRWIFSAGILVCVAHFLICHRMEAWASVGVSFYVLQAIGYLVDVRRERIAPETRFPVFLTSMSCFVYVTAGPVVNARSMLQQLRAPEQLTERDATVAIFRISTGLAKKALGDSLAGLAQQYFNGPGLHDWIMSWVTLLAIAGCYYADFSGYSDIAIGIGRLLGLKLPENFRVPYLAESVAEHWKRWHMSLSNWASEYLFMPLCLARSPLQKWKLRPELQENLQIGFSLVCAFAIIGLWHGLNFNDLAWGLYNAGLIIAGYLLGSTPLRRVPLGRAGRILMVFYLVSLGRVLNWTPSWSVAWGLIRELHGFTVFEKPDAWDWLRIGGVLLGLLVPHALDSWVLRKGEGKLGGRWTWAASGLMIFIYFMLGAGSMPFLYEGN